MEVVPSGKISKAFCTHNVRAGGLLSRVYGILFFGSDLSEEDGEGIVSGYVDSL